MQPTTTIIKRKLGKIIIILMFLQCCLETQYASAYFIEQEQPSIENIIRGYNAEELIIFNEELGVDPQQLFLAIQENPDQIKNERIPNTQNRYDALILFILGTLALFLIIRYGSTILENLFDFAREMPGAIQRSIAGIIRFAAETGRLNAVYDITTREAQNLLNDPDTANRVIRGMQRVQEFRNR